MNISALLFSLHALTAGNAPADLQSASIVSGSPLLGAQIQRVQDLLKVSGIDGVRKEFTVLQNAPHLVVLPKDEPRLTGNLVRADITEDLAAIAKDKNWTISDSSKYPAAQVLIHQAIRALPRGDYDVSLKLGFEFELKGRSYAYGDFFLLEDTQRPVGSLKSHRPEANKAIVPPSAWQYWSLDQTYSAQILFTGDASKRPQTETLERLLKSHYDQVETRIVSAQREIMKFLPERQRKAIQTWPIGKQDTPFVETDIALQNFVSNAIIRPNAPADTAPFAQLLQSKTTTIRLRPMLVLVAIQPGENMEHISHLRLVGPL